MDDSFSPSFENDYNYRAHNIMTFHIKFVFHLTRGEQR